MANLKEVKNRIQSVSSTQQITKAMKMVAAAKLRRAQDAIIQMRPYAQKLISVVNNVSASADPAEISSIYTQQHKVESVLIVVASSDRGLCGGFNSNSFKHTKTVIKEKYQGQVVTIMPIGRKAYEHFKKRGYNIIEKFVDLFGKLNFNNAQYAAQYVMNEFKNREYDRVEIVYNEFKNVATQFIRNEQFLPIVSSDEKQTKEVFNDYIIEPNKEEVFNQLISKSLKIQFYKNLLESNVSEHGARMTAMDKASENANELLKELKLTYNRTRQAAITKEILEIVGGAEALEQG